MAHGLQQSVLKQQNTKGGDNNNNNKTASGGKTGIGSRRIFPPHFKLQVLDSYRNDSDCKGNQRATARKYGIHRRQIQKWLQAETNLRNSVSNSNNQGSKGGNSTNNTTSAASNNAATTLMSVNVGCDLSLSGCCRLRDDSVPDAYYNEQRVPCLGVQEHCCANAAAMDYSSSSSSSSSSLCDMPLSSSTSTLNLPSPSLSPSQYHNKSPSPVMIDHPYLSTYHPTPIIHEPIDLSLKHLRAISPYDTVKCLPVQPTPIYVSACSNEVTDPEVWDLSVRKRAFKQELEMEPPAKRPVKLFKPYLDDNQDSDDPNEADVKPVLNNNYNSPDYSTNPCCPSSSYYYQSSSVPCQGYSCYNPMVVPLKQRQSYSVDFKLRAIETYYYGEECCRGNQRAVASKYNVHRRQVQKWLRQEDELRTRVVDEPAQQMMLMMENLPLVR